MIENLQEYVDARGTQLRVDRGQAVIRGVKILGQESRNGRTYLPAALSAAAALYEGTKVNVNHPKGSPLAARDYQERIGVLRSVAARGGEGLFADFHFNPKHALAEQLLWDAEHAPENVGFSHNVEARVARRGERSVVEAILKVQGVDLVADPATTRAGCSKRRAVALSLLVDLPRLVALSLRDRIANPARKPRPLRIPRLTCRGATGLRPAIAAARSGRPRAAPHRWRNSPSNRSAPRGPDLVEAIGAEQRAAQSDELQRLRSELSRLQLAEALRGRRELAHRLIREFELPDPDDDDEFTRAVVGGDFFESLLHATDEGGMRQLVEERARLVAGATRLVELGRPQGGRIVSREQGRGEASVEFDPQRFAQLLRMGS